MRIAVAGPLGNDSFADNVVDQLRDDGHDVLPLGPARPAVAPSRLNGLVSVVSDHYLPLDARRQAPMHRRIKEFRPEVFITVDRRIHSSTISAAHSVGARTALWFPDAVGTMGLHDMFTNGYDRIYLKNPTLVGWLQEIQGLPVRYLPEAGNPRWHRSQAAYGTAPVIVMAGNCHPTRAVLLQRLLDAGFPLRIYGAPVPRWLDYPEIRDAHSGEYLTQARKAHIFRSARVVLNNLHPAEYAGTNCRLFEATMAGAVVLTERRPGLDSLFVPGTEIETFGSFDELSSVCSRLLDSADEGRDLANSAAARALRDHTYAIRLGSLLADLVG